MDAIFRVDGNDVVTSPYAAGPWDPGMQHGSPPAALVVWAAERIPTPVVMRIARVTVDLMRPVPVAPLTTATSSREYVVGGTFIGALSGPEEARGVLEVGYDIGCGIDMSTSNGVSLTGTTGLTPTLGVTGPIAGLPTTVAPVISAPVGGAITVGLKPGLVNIVPLDKKEFKSNNPWVMVSNFRIKIDGCVGQSFIRSYAILTRQTDQSDVVLSYIGVTQAV